MKFNALLTLLALLALSALPAHAAEGGILTPEGGLMTWTIIVFGLVLFVLYKFAFPFILGAVEAREARIRELLAAAARDRDEAQVLLEEQKKEMESLRGRAQEVVAEARTAGERMREELLTQARREQEEMMTRTRRDLDLQVQRALEQVRDEAVELAIAAASKLVERNLDEEDNRRFVRDFLAQVEQQRGAGVPAGV
jgi:F-type H+-transporting ATPase subunit b